MSGYFAPHRLSLIIRLDVEHTILRRTMPSLHCADGVYYLNCSMGVETAKENSVFILGAD